MAYAHGVILFHIPAIVYYINTLDGLGSQMCSPVVMSFMVVLPPNLGGGIFVFKFYCIFITKLFSILTEFLIFEKKIYKISYLVHTWGKILIS